MDLYRIIRDLLDERRRLDALITRIERTHANQTARAKTPAKAKKRRGRKSMNEEQRREVSERMSRYWANRRSTKTADSGSK